MVCPVRERVGARPPDRPLRRRPPPPPPPARGELSSPCRPTLPCPSASFKVITPPLCSSPHTRPPAPSSVSTPTHQPRSPAFQRRRTGVPVAVQGQAPRAAADLAAARTLVPAGRRARSHRSRPWTLHRDVGTQACTRSAAGRRAGRTSSRSGGTGQARAGPARRSAGRGGTRPNDEVRTLFLFRPVPLTRPSLPSQSTQSNVQVPNLVRLLDPSTCPVFVTSVRPTSLPPCRPALERPGADPALGLPLARSLSCGGLHCRLLVAPEEVR